MSDDRLPDPPPGWLALQEKARTAKDAKELSAIIDEMNALLSTYEKAAGDGHLPDGLPSGIQDHKPASKRRPK